MIYQRAVNYSRKSSDHNMQQIYTSTLDPEGIHEDSLKLDQ